MNRRRTLLSAAALLTATGVAFAHYPPRWVAYPPPVYVVPFDPCVCPPAPPAPVADCPPAAMTTPAKPLAPPKVMEKPAAPKVMEKPEPPKPVKPAASEEPAEKPKGELAIPSPAVPEAPVEKPKVKVPEPAPFTLPPIEATPAKPKKEEAPKLELPKAETPALTLPPTTGEQPKKADDFTLPPLTLPKTTESKYTPAAETKVRVVPVEGRRSAGNQTVNFYNYTARDLQLNVDGKLQKIPAKSLLAVALPDAFAWTFGEKSETLTIPTDAAGLSIIFQ